MGKYLITKKVHKVIYFLRVEPELIWEGLKNNATAFSDYEPMIILVLAIRKDNPGKEKQYSYISIK